MNWRDFLYFSHGERRALLVLLSLILISWILLFFIEKPTAPAPRTQVAAFPDTVSTLRVSVSEQSAPQQVAGSFRKRPFISSKTTSTSSRRNKSTILPSYPRTEKYPPGTRVELNTADTVSLKKIPGIGSTFASRIVKYRNLLGGFFSIDQLKEVYGIDENKFQALSPWFTVDTAYLRKVVVNRVSDSSFRKHPYLDYRQMKVLKQLKKQKGQLTGWENLLLLEEFSEKDRIRLHPYLSFE